MKKIKLLFGLCLSMLAFTSCEDEDKLRFTYGDPVAPGAFVTADVTTAVVNGEDIPSGVYALTVDAPSNNVTSYDMTVRMVPANGDPATDFLPLLSVNSFPSDIVITTSQLASVFGLTVGDLSLGDTFEFVNTSTGTDGSITTFNDLDSDVQSEVGQKQAYSLSTLIVCPLTEGLYTGTYEVSTTVGGCFGDIFLIQDVELSEISVYQRSFEANYLEQFGVGQPDMTFTIEFLCGVVTGRDNMSTFLGCAGGSLFLNSSPLAGPYDSTDDSTLVVNARENCTGCGGAPEGEIQLTFTKQ